MIVRGTSETYTSNGTISLKNAINGVSVENNVLTVAYSVPVDTIITLVAAHNNYPNITTEFDVQVSMVYEQIDLTSLGLIGDLETADSYSFIKLPEQIDGNVNGISYGEAQKYTGISVSDGELAVPNSWVTEIYNAYGYSEQSVKLYTDTDKCYTVKMAIVTKAIANQTDLLAIAVTGNTLDGYYVLTEDIGCDGTTAINLVGTYSSSATAGFIGTFDGRGHSISNANVGANGFFNCIGAGTVKNLALVDVVGTNHVLAQETHSSTIENVYISSDSCVKAINYAGNCTFRNIIAVLPNGQTLIWTYGSATVNNTISNVYTVMASPVTNDGWSGTKVPGFFRNYYKSDDPVTLYNLQHFTSVEALLAALEANNSLTAWNSSFSYADGKLLFNGTPLFFEEAALTNPINLGDVSTVAKETVIDVPAEITGNIIGISTSTTGRMTDGVECADGKLTLAQKTVENLAVGGWGENSLKIYTDEGKVYSASIFLVTKIIKNQADLAALDTNKVLDGYYILANDIECDGTTPISISCYTSTTTSGFIGTFDGRGYAIKNVNVGSTGLFEGIGKGTVKNVALIGVVGTNKALSDEIHGSTIENVFISSDSCLKAIGYVGDSKITNVIAVLPNGQHAIQQSGNSAAATAANNITNVYSVVANPAYETWCGTGVPGIFKYYYCADDATTLYNLKSYTTVDGLLEALAAGDMLSGWSYFSFADGVLSFGENIVAE